MKIIKCQICGSWLASNNPLFLKEHKDNCRPKRSKERHISWCLINIDNRAVKAAVTPKSGGNFEILWITKEYAYLLNKDVDASDIRKVMLGLKK